MSDMEHGRFTRDARAHAGGGAAAVPGTAAPQASTPQSSASLRLPSFRLTAPEVPTFLEQPRTAMPTRPAAPARVATPRAFSARNHAAVRPTETPQVTQRATHAPRFIVPSAPVPHQGPAYEPPAPSRGHDDAPAAAPDVPLPDLPAPPGDPFAMIWSEPVAEALPWSPPYIELDHEQLSRRRPHAVASLIVALALLAAGVQVTLSALDIRVASLL